MDESVERDIHFLDYWRVIRSRKEIVLAVALLVVITATAYTFTRPKVYMSYARIEVRADQMDMDVFERQTQSYNPYFMRTQYEIIKSRGILYEVIDTLGLQRKWGEKFEVPGGEFPLNDTYNILNSRTKIKPFRDTTLVDVQVFGEDREECAEIADAVAGSYRDRRLNLKRLEINRAINALATELQKQQEVVDQAEAKLEEIRSKMDISILGGFTADSIRVQRLEGDRISARVDSLVRKSRLDQVMSLSEEELMHAVGYVVADPTFQRLKQAYIDTKVSLRLLLEQFGPEHPDVKRLEAGVDELGNQLSEALGGMKKGLQADYEVSRQKFEELNRALEEVREQEISAQGTKLLPFGREMRNVEIQRQILSALRAKVAQEGIEIKVPRTPVDIIEPAVASPEDEPVSPKVALNIIVSICVGLGLGIGMAYFIEYLDTSVKTVDDVEQYLGLPVIGIVPQKVRPLSEEGPESPHAEAYRLLRTNMQFTNKGLGGGAFAVVSGGVGEGKSTTLFNLAYVCAQLGDKVLIVDSDLRRPVQHTFLGMGNRFGLTNLLMRDASVEEIIKPTSIPNLHIIPSGQLPRTGLGLLDSQRMRDLIKNVKARYDYVFLDAPPLMGVSDASILASEADSVLLVIEYRKYPRTMSARAKHVVENVGGKILGVVLNNINIMRDDYYYYYHTHYTHYATPIEAEDDPESMRLAESESAVEEREEVY